MLLCATGLHCLRTPILMPRSGAPSLRNNGVSLSTNSSMSSSAVHGARLRKHKEGAAQSRDRIARVIAPDLGTRTQGQEDRSRRHARAHQYSRRWLCPHRKSRFHPCSRLGCCMLARRVCTRFRRHHLTSSRTRGTLRHRSRGPCRRRTAGSGCLGGYRGWRMN